MRLGALVVVGTLGLASVASCGSDATPVQSSAADASVARSTADGSGPPVGSCVAEFCPHEEENSGCCLAANGPCGVDYGEGCELWRNAGSCVPEFCSADGDDPGCCLAANGPCGVDYGEGCETRRNAGSCVPEFCPNDGDNQACCVAPNGPCGANYGGGCERWRFGSDAATPSTPTSDAGAGDATGCAPSRLVLVPHVSSTADGGVSSRLGCGELPSSTVFHVWVFDAGALVRQTTVDCDGEIDLGAFTAGQYEVAVLNNEGCTEIGAGSIPVNTSLSQLCGGASTACDPVVVIVAPCGTSRVEFEVACREDQRPACSGSCAGG